MKQLYNSFVATCIIAGLALSQPKLSIDKTEIDLGRMCSGEKKEGNIIVRNTGNDTLRIFHVGTSCECTTVKSPKAFLLPGQSDDVEFEFSPSETQGKVERYVYINTNDPTLQYLSVKLIAEIKEVFQWIVGSNSLSIIENAINGKPVTKRIAIKNVSGLPMSILGDSVSSPSMSVSMDKKSLQPNDTLHVDVTVVPKKLGLSHETLYMITDNTMNPRVEVSITILGTQGN
jgi:hypothetical protein